MSEENSVNNSKNVVQNSPLHGESIHIGDVNNYGEKKNVRSIPYFFSETKGKNKDQRSYQDYLNADIFPYRDRTSYKKDHPEETKGLITEEDILEILYNENKLGSIIMGRGGIGKTRTMYEVGLLAHKAGWKTWVIDFGAAYVDSFFVRLGEDDLKEEKHLLVFDYIEESESFDTIVKQLAQYHKGGNIRVLGNCRKSFSRSLKSSLDTAAKFFPIINFTTEETGETAYQNFVINQITNPFRKKIITKSIFKLRSSFAVFLRYLFDTKKDNLNLQGDITFEAWLIRRLKLTLENHLPTGTKFDEYLDEIIQQLLLLPVSGEAAEDCLDESILHQKLITDGWLQMARDRLDTIHDTIKDTLLVYFLDGKDLLQGVRQSFKFAYQHNGLKNWVRSYERILDEDLFQSDFFFNFFIRTLKKNKYPDFNTYHLIKSALLSEEQKFDLIVQRESFFADFVLSNNFGLPLAFALNFFSKEENQKNTPPRLQQLVQNWINANQSFVDSPFLADRILSTYLKKYGHNEFIQSYLEQFIKNQNPVSGNYTFRVWLEQGGDKEWIKAHVERYLQANAADKEAPFVFKAWLDQGGETEWIKAHVERYLQANAADKEAQFVFKAWLEQGGDKEWIKAHVERYLQVNAADKEASFVFKAWLEQGGKVAVVRSYVYKYLEKNAALYSSSFVYQAYLKKANYDKDNLKPYLQQWLARYAKNKNTKYLLILWLTQTKDNPFIKPYLQEWLDEYPYDTFASKLQKEWIKNDTDT
ncbi:MAG: hypothetical protein AB8E82_12510 [Aureispira sp.]